MFWADLSFDPPFLLFEGGGMVAFMLGQRLSNLQLVGIERIKDQGSNSILKRFTRVK
jgi:hypothetical protein